MDLPIKVEGIIYRQGDHAIEILCLKRIPEDGGFWQPLTGTVDLEESIPMTLYRELEEETGIKNEHVINISDILHSFHWFKGETVILEFIFAISVESGVNVLLSPKEHSEYEWLTPEKAINMFKYENNKLGVRKLLETIPGSK